jgi:hypothetical protein
MPSRVMDVAIDAGLRRSVARAVVPVHRFDVTLGRKTLARAPDNVTARILLAAALINLNQYDAAATSLTPTLETLPAEQPISLREV